MCSPRKARRVNPVKCDLTVIRRLAYPCTLLPAGQPAHVSLNGKPYVVTAEGDCVIFHSDRDSHTVSHGGCTCGDYVFVREARGEACKHVVAAGKMRAEGAV
jgi:hypothetical protein